jgi:hypothetical protein
MYRYELNSIMRKLSVIVAVITVFSICAVLMLFDFYHFPDVIIFPPTNVVLTKPVGKVRSTPSRWSLSGKNFSFSGVDFSKVHKNITRDVRIRMVTYSDRLALCLKGSDPNGESCLAVKPIYDVNKAYAIFHNYSFTVHSERKLPLLPHPWEKIAVVKEALLEGADAVLWIDHDAYIQQSTVSLNSWLLRNPSRNLIIGEHNSYPWEVNTGLFLVRNTNWSLAMLDAVLEMSECDIYRQNTDCCWEQDCVQLIAKEKLLKDWDQLCRTVPAYLFNCRSEWKGMESCAQTGFAYHFMGQPKGYREIHESMQSIQPIKVDCEDTQCRKDALLLLDSSFSNGHNEFADAVHVLHKVVQPGLLTICHFSLKGGHIIPTILSGNHSIGAYVIFEDVDSEGFLPSYYITSDFLRASYPGIKFLFYEGKYNETVRSFAREFFSPTCNIILWNQELTNQDLIALDVVWSPFSIVLLKGMSCNSSECFNSKKVVLFDFLPCRSSLCSDWKSLTMTLHNLMNRTSLDSEPVSLLSDQAYVLKECLHSLIIGTTDLMIC